MTEPLLPPPQPAAGSRPWLGLALAAGYLLASVRLFPDDPVRTLQESLVQLLRLAPFVAGLTLFAASLLRRLTGEPLGWRRLASLYLGTGLLVEILIGLHDYLSRHQ
ncbi:MAG: hypothetical protein AB1634_10685 [Thermodesulfobacteriota bacterium]